MRAVGATVGDGARRSPAPTARANRRGIAGALLMATFAAACGGGDAGEGAGDAPAIQPTPPGTDVWLADMHWEQSGPPSIGDAVNVTARTGYDNQPYWLPDGSGFWYTVIDEHTGQADIYRYDLGASMVARVTQSAPESEYSATPLPDGSGISTIRVEADSTQRLWRFDPDGSNAAVLLENVAPVGYHAWADERTAVMFVLGAPATLQRADVVTGSVEVIAEDIGRSIQRIPGGNDVSFVQRHADDSWTIMRLRPGSSEPEPIIEARGAGEFHAWAHDGTLLMAEGSTVYAFTEGVTDGWTPVGDFTGQRITITRLAASPDGSQIALVGEPVFQP